MSNAGTDATDGEIRVLRPLLLTLRREGHSDQATLLLESLSNVFQGWSESESELELEFGSAFEVWVDGEGDFVVVRIAF